MAGLFVFLCFLAAAVVVSGHSWIACTDYLQEDGHYWDPKLCRAFPRHGHQYTPKDNFGLDKGYDFHVKPSQPCRTVRDDEGAYTPQYPRAVYYLGQNVILAHPTKNHVADSRCTNNHIPDKGNKLYIGTRNARQDLSYDGFKQSLIHDWGVSPTGSNTDTTKYPKPGYQNAPKFCEDKDKALATYAFKIPTSILAGGNYTFLWTWSFNSLSDTYGSCWEASIVATKAERDALYRNHQPAISTDEPAKVLATGITVGGSGGNTGGSSGISTGAPTSQPNSGQWGEWSAFGQCYRLRTRRCSIKDACQGDSKEVLRCDCETSVGNWGSWSMYSSCSVSCGTGQRTRTRQCIRPFNGESSCPGAETETIDCSLGGCQLVKGNWNTWSSWNPCSKTCGNGVQRRTRICDNPLPQTTEQRCQGAEEESRPCNLVTCPFVPLPQPGIVVALEKSCTPWDSGIGCEIKIPGPKPRPRVRITVTLPCPTNIQMNVWHATDVTSLITNRKPGQFFFDRIPTWQREKDTVGFNAGFAQGTCTGATGGILKTSDVDITMITLP